MNAAAIRSRSAAVCRRNQPIITYSRADTGRPSIVVAAAAVARFRNVASRDETATLIQTRAAAQVQTADQLQKMWISIS